MLYVQLSLYLLRLRNKSILISRIVGTDIQSYRGDVQALPERPQIRKQEWMTYSLRW